MGRGESCSTRVVRRSSGQAHWVMSPRVLVTSVSLCVCSPVRPEGGPCAKEGQKHGGRGSGPAALLPSLSLGLPIWRVGLRRKKGDEPVPPPRA